MKLFKMEYSTTFDENKLVGNDELNVKSEKIEEEMEVKEEEMEVGKEEDDVDVDNNINMKIQRSFSSMIKQ